MHNYDLQPLYTNFESFSNISQKVEEVHFQSTDRQMNEWKTVVVVESYQKWKLGNYIKSIAMKNSMQLHVWQSYNYMYDKVINTKWFTAD